MAVKRAALSLLVLLCASAWTAVQAQSLGDCEAAQALLAQNPSGKNPCYADNGSNSGCKTKAKVGSCEIKMCQNPVGSGTKIKDCYAVSQLATSIITGKQKTAPAGTGQFAEGPAGLTISVEKTDPKDTSNGNCGSPSSPCRF